MVALELPAARQRQPGPIAVVIPMFRHSALVFDAIASLLVQPTFGKCQVVVVDDGCPNFQTVATLAGLSDLHDNIHYIRQINRGLSGARNRGLDYVLARFPETEAIYFLDADDRIEPHSFSRFEAILAQSDADWFYPDVTLFGMHMTGDYSGPFRRLTLHFANVCAATSLVRTRMLKAGLRYDEQMKDGFEDWEFWINAISQGFRGEHLPNMGFQYRRRGESMVSESQMMASGIISYMEKKHSWMHDVSLTVMLEHIEAPRFAILSRDSRRARITSDPARSERHSAFEDYADLLPKSFARPNWHAVGSIVVMASDAVLDLLKRHGLLNYVFWDLEHRLMTEKRALVSISSGRDGGLSVKRGALAEGAAIQIAAITMPELREEILGTATTAKMGDAKTGDAETGDDEADNTVRYLELPDLDVEDALAAHGAADRDLAAFIRRESARDYPELWAERLPAWLGTFDVAVLPVQARQRFDEVVLPNRVGRRKGRMAMVLPEFDGGDTARAAVGLARQMRQAGYVVDLFVLGSPDIALRERHRAVFEAIYVLDQFAFNAFTGPEFNGTPLPSLSFPKPCAELTNLLSVYEVVIGSHAADVLGSFGALRKRGVVTINYLHLLDHLPSGRIAGHTMRALAYEHATDLFVTSSGQLATELGMMGVPGEKVVAAAATPGLEPDEARIETCLKERRRRAGEMRPLNVLMAGGGPGTQELLSELKRDSGRFNPVIAGVEVGDDDAAADIYGWADVLLLPGRLEEAPTLLLDAMMYGVVAIAIDADALGEIIKSGVNGILVGEQDAAAQVLADILRLEADRPRLATMAERAAASVDERARANPVAAMLAALGRLTAARQRRDGMEWLDAELAALESKTAR